MLQIPGLPSMCFSCSMPDINFSIASDHRAHVVMSTDGGNIYDELLFPVNGSISLLDLSQLIEPYARQQLVVNLWITVTDQSVDDEGKATNHDSATISTQVVYCMADVGIAEGVTTAQEFCLNHFLTMLMGTKRTALGRLEYLHFVGSDSATVAATYGDGTTVSFPATVVGGNGQYTTLDVSPGRFQAEGKTLVGYTVTAGNRSQTFEVLPEVADVAPIIAFDNSFGCQEIVYCTGTHTVDPSYKRSTMRRHGHLRNYQIEETRTFKADTGILNAAEANWLDDLFRSQCCYVMNVYNGAVTRVKEVVITDSKSEQRSDDDALPRFTFSYQYAQRNQNVLDLRRAGRIFDNTFDFTFN
ncbi:MAG: hypothetical protein J5953_09595 [Prevotella sp.]|nr:hypothetical protein [Prevotella sp.]